MSAYRSPLPTCSRPSAKFSEYFAERRCAGSEPEAAVAESLKAVIPPVKLGCVVQLLEGELDQTYAVDGRAEFKRMVDTCECYYEQVQAI